VLEGKEACGSVRERQIVEWTLRARVWAVFLATPSLP
jgi:hypothetical protein